MAHLFASDPRVDKYKELLKTQMFDFQIMGANDEGKVHKLLDRHQKQQTQFWIQQLKPLISKGPAAMGTSKPNRGSTTTIKAESFKAPTSFSKKNPRIKHIQVPVGTEVIDLVSDDEEVTVAAPNQPSAANTAKSTSWLKSEAPITSSRLAGPRTPGSPSARRKRPIPPDSRTEISPSEFRSHRIDRSSILTSPRSLSRHSNLYPSGQKKGHGLAKDMFDGRGQSWAPELSNASLQSREKRYSSSVKSEFTQVKMSASQIKRTVPCIPPPFKCLINSLYDDSDSPNESFPSPNTPTTPCPSRPTVEAGIGSNFKFKKPTLPITPIADRSSNEIRKESLMRRDSVASQSTLTTLHATRESSTGGERINQPTPASKPAIPASPGLKRKTNVTNLSDEESNLSDGESDISDEESNFDPSEDDASNSSPTTSKKSRSNVGNQGVDIFLPIGAPFTPPSTPNPPLLSCKTNVFGSKPIAAYQNSAAMPPLRAPRALATPSAFVVTNQLLEQRRSKRQKRIQAEEKLAHMARDDTLDDATYEAEKGYVVDGDEVGLAEENLRSLSVTPVPEQEAFGRQDWTGRRMRGDRWIARNKRMVGGESDDDE
jgi:hypothetical protein